MQRQEMHHLLVIVNRYVRSKAFSSPSNAFRCIYRFSKQQLTTIIGGSRLLPDQKKQRTFRRSHNFARMYECDMT